MKSKAVVWLGRAAGLGLIVVVLSLVGWADRVTDTEADEHTGRVVDVTETTATFADGSVVPIDGVGEVKRGLRGPFLALLENPVPAVAGLLIHLFALFIIGLRWAILLRGANLPLPIRSVLRLHWVGHFLGTVVPGGLASGDVIKSLYVAHEHHCTRTRALVTAFTDRVLALLVLGVLACVALMAGPEGLQVETARTVVLALLVGGAVAGLLFYSAALRRVLRMHHLARKLPFPGVVAEAKEALLLYRGRPRHVVATLVAALVGHLALLAGFYLYGTALGAEMTVAVIFIAIPVAQVLSSVPGLPGGWGVGDLAYYLLLPAVGVPAGLAVALSFTFRVVQLLLGLPGGLMLTKRI
ncbi:MAG: lysylphosphatidylglycerol synthase transmembrane domain-containing protein [Planctomycetota bacterium]